jgi:O-antigen/teichoic acid export membrane protein
MQNINQRMAKGIVWMVAARLLDRSIGLISTLFLARLLVPEDFGLVAMATAIGGILGLFGAFSFDMALIQNANAERRHYDTVWTFNVIFGVFCTFALISVAEIAAIFYKEPRLTNVMYALSIFYFISAFGNIGVVAFRKEMNFKKEFIFIFSSRIATFIVTITAAFFLQSYWALLIGMTSGRTVSFFMSYKMNDYRPKFTLSATRELFNFSKWLLINNLLFFILHDGCTFIIGRMFGANELGIYSVSYEISSMPSTELVAPINRVAFPGFSKMKDVKVISDSYLKLFGLISLVIFPLGIGIASVAKPLVLTVLGSKWTATIPLIQLLALHGAIAATQGNNGMVWMALGRPRITTISAVLFLTVLLPSLYFFLNSAGIIGAGYAYILANISTLPFGLYMSRKLLEFRWSDIFLLVWRPVIGVVFMYVSVEIVDSYIDSALPLSRLIGDAIVGAITYSFFIIFLWILAGRPEGSEQYLLNKLGEKLKTFSNILIRKNIFDK